MSRYVNIKVNISEGQMAKIKQAINAGHAVSIRLSHSDLSGEHMLALTQAQVNKMAKAYQNGTGITIKISKTQLEHNKTVVGGFIGAILPFLATAGKFLLSSVIPSLATGLLGGIGAATGTKVVDKISGSGIMYLKKNGLSCKVIPAGQGLYLTPWNKGSAVGSGLYIKSGSGYVDGRGLLLGPNSPFQNIPILGMIL
jgi:hypothetical protein